MRRMAMLVTVVLAMMALGTGVATAASAQASIDPQAPIADPPLPPGYNPCWPVATEPWCNDGGGTQVGILLLPFLIPQAPITYPLSADYNPCWPVASEPWCPDLRP